MMITGNVSDSLKFKVPTLRNSNVSSNYMHDGRFGTRFDEARAEAELADRRLASEDVASLPPLHGVPCTIKECFAPRGFRPSSDAPAVTRLRDAGAIPVCVTNVSELHVDGELQPGRHTNNPYDPSRIVWPAPST